MVEVAPHRDNTNLVYFLNKQIPPAEAVITELGDNSVEVWLGGIEAQSIQAFNRGATFSAIDPQQNQIATIQLDSREGLVGYGKLVSNPQQSLSRGNLLQEEIRSIPADVKLTIGIDDGLRDSLSEIQQAFAQFKRIAVVPLQQGEVDYILGRVTGEILEAQLSIKPPLDSLGLFYPDLSIIPGSFHTGDETIKSAGERLTSKLQSLLAIKLIRLTLNPDSSRLKVTANLYNRNNPQQSLVEAVGTQSELQNNWQNNLQNSNPAFEIPQIPLKTPLQFAIANKENRSLYISVLAIDAEGQIIVLFPNHWTRLAEQTTIPAHKTIIIPELATTQLAILSIGFEVVA